MLQALGRSAGKARPIVMTEPIEERMPPLPAEPETRPKAHLSQTISLVTHPIDKPLHITSLRQHGTNLGELPPQAIEVCPSRIRHATGRRRPSPKGLLDAVVDHVGERMRARRHAPLPAPGERRRARDQALAREGITRQTR